MFDIGGTILPGTLGTVGFFDVGRVWTTGESSSRWHKGYGGGLWYDIAGEIGRTYEGLMGMLPADQWMQFQELSHAEFLQLLMTLAHAVDLAKYRKHPRGPKKAKPKRTTHAGEPHVSTAKLLRRQRCSTRRPCRGWSVLRECGDVSAAVDD